MFKFLIIAAILALCRARPGNIGYGGPAYAAIATPAVAVAPAISVNSGISSQSRVDYRTPVVASVAVPAVASYGLGYGINGNAGVYGGTYGSGGYGNYGYGLGLGH